MPRYLSAGGVFLPSCQFAPSTANLCHHVAHHWSFVQSYLVPRLLRSTCSGLVLTLGKAQREMSPALYQSAKPCTPIYTRRQAFVRLLGLRHDRRPWHREQTSLLRSKSGGSSWDRGLYCLGARLWQSQRGGYRFLWVSSV